MERNKKSNPIKSFLRNHRLVIAVIILFGVHIYETTETLHRDNASKGSYLVLPSLLAIFIFGRFTWVHLKNKNKYIPKKDVVQIDKELKICEVWWTIIHVLALALKFINLLHPYNYQVLGCIEVIQIILFFYEAKLLFKMYDHSQGPTNNFGGRQKLVR